MDVSKAVGHKSPNEDVAYNTRDLILYALGIGVTDLKYTYELNKSFQAFPTYGLVLPLKGSTQDISPYGTRGMSFDKIPGLPKLDLRRLVHGDQYYELLSPLPTTETSLVKTNVVSGVYDAGKGLVLENTSELQHNGRPLVRTISTAFIIGAGGFGGPKRPAVKQAASPPAGRAPDNVSTTRIREDQALLYRLSGDYNPLHVDESIGKKLGMNGAFLHGLCTLGVSVAAVLKAYEGKGWTFKSVYGRFASPVYMGEEVTVRMWDLILGEGRIAYESFVGDRIVIAGGCIVLNVSSESKL